MPADRTLYSELGQRETKLMPLRELNGFMPGNKRWACF